ncbi:ATP-binding protein [Actinomycetospora sp. CA-053990]|uniref:ATP-binding protein n=1 Tax=Actinomycetospora sp. CA-053990 TaxID=3239891 RepID=UPI003D924E60
MITNRDLECLGLATGCVCPAGTDTAGIRGAWLWERRPARPETVVALRRLVRRWTAATVADEEIGESIVLLVDEAVSNAVEHAYRGPVGDVSLFAAPRPCGYGVVVEDQGVWSPPDADPGFRGRGLDLVRELSDHHVVMGSELGTTVRMCWRTHVTS